MSPTKSATTGHKFWHAKSNFLRNYNDHWLNLLVISLKSSVERVRLPKHHMSERGTSENNWHQIDVLLVVCWFFIVLIRTPQYTTVCIYFMFLVDNFIVLRNEVNGRAWCSQMSPQKKGKIAYICDSMGFLSSDEFTYQWRQRYLNKISLYIYVNLIFIST